MQLYYIPRSLQSYIIFVFPENRWVKICVKCRFIMLVPEDGGRNAVIRPSRSHKMGCRSLRSAQAYGRGTSGLFGARVVSVFTGLSPVKTGLRPVATGLRPVFRCIGGEEIKKSRTGAERLVRRMRKERLSVCAVRRGAGNGLLFAERSAAVSWGRACDSSRRSS